MSDFSPSIRSSRRSSITSRLSTSTYMTTLPSLEVQSIRNFARSNWYETFTFFVSSLPPHEFVEHELYTDVLKCLCDDKLSDSATVHLLSLFEHFSHLLTESDLLEQIVGSLLNLFTTRKWKLEIQQKLLSTICTLLITNYELVEQNAQIKEMLHLFIKILIKTCSNKDQSDLHLHGSECLNQIEQMFPNILQTEYEEQKLSKNYLPLLFTFLTHGYLNTDDAKQSIQKLDQLEHRNAAQFFSSLSSIFNYLIKKRNDYYLSSSLFQKYLASLTYSFEMQSFHLCLLIHQQFGSIFSEQSIANVLQRLMSSCVHPSLTPAERLMHLEFVLNQLPLLKEHQLLNESQIVQIQPAFDGPDTQEKKLSILTHGSISDDELIFCIKPLKQLSLDQFNPRASNALYRCLNCMLKIRPSMIPTIKYLLLSMILKSPQQHICRTLSLLRLWPNLSEHVLRSIIQETINHTDNFHDEIELKAYFQAFEWILRKADFQIDEKDTVAILNFIFKKIETIGALHSYAINCCSAIMRNQYLTESVKQNLIKVLNYLRSSKFLTLQQSSWVQIFLIAIQSLPNEDNFKHILNDPFACEAVLFKRARKDIDFPITIRLINSNTFCRIPFQSDTFEAFKLPFKFELSINLQFNIASEEESNHELFTIEFGIENDHQQIFEEQIIDYLDESESKQITFNVDILQLVDFDLNVNVRCSNVFGHLFSNTSIVQSIKVIDLFLPCQLNSQFFKKFWLQTNESDSSESQWKKHVICLSKIVSVIDLIHEIPWLNAFVFDSNHFSIAVPNNAFVFGQFQESDNWLQVQLITNHDYALKAFLSQIEQFV